LEKGKVFGNMQRDILKKDWLIDAEAFKSLLVWLDCGKDSDGQRYLEIRGRLVSFFDRKNSLNPDDLADETLNRVARRLSEEEIESETPEKFCYITAKFVFLESLRTKEKSNISIDEITENKLLSKNFDEKVVKEKMLDCLEHCTESLEITKREIIFGYYYGEERIKIENRKNLATKLGFSINALSIRACRIREKLHICVVKCVEKNNL
jgi:DNA-directed RNA polymerase specialized sigma24 family protein